ncbi:MAG: ABC transporter permease [Clostridia bacterium]|nr:ABC transporter permease [Clostridia bacterium]
MKSKRLIYFILQLKRKAKLLPRVLALTLALVIIAGAAGFMIYKNSMNDESKRLITIGIVGNDKSKLIDTCVNALKTLDSSRYAVKIEKMTEDEAQNNLLGGAISGYIVVPDNYAKDIYYGRDSRLKYVSIGGASGIGMALISELIGITAKVGLENTNAIYGAQFYVRDHFPDKNASDAGDRLFEKYAALILTRNELYSVKKVGVSGHPSLLVYLICGLAIMFLLLWGVSCSPLFRRNGELSCMLSTQGLGATGQILGESGAYFVLMLLCTVPLFAGLKAIVSLLNIDLGEFASLLSGKFIALYFLCAFMLCMMQLFLYELARDGISAPVLQFLNAIVQGYICGCFYPQSFFPEGVRLFASHLPVGVAVRILGEASPSAITEALIYAALFFAASVLLRRRTITRWEAQL